MTPPDEPPSNPYDPNWPKPEQPYGQPPAAQPPADQSANPPPYAPYGQQPPYGQEPYGQQPPYGQAPYGQQPPYGQAPYGQQQPYGTPSYGGSVMSAHPSATTSLVLGLVALVGMFICGLPIFLAPIAWIMGGRAVKEIDANPGRFSGREQAQAGRIMGIIGTALLAFAVIAGLGLVMFAIAASPDTSGGYSDSSTDTGSDF